MALGLTYEAMRFMSHEFITLAESNIHLFAPLYVAVFNAAPWLDGWSNPVATERLQGFAKDPSFRGIGIQQKSEPVGLVIGARERWSTGLIFHLKEMCVAAEHQGKGLGQKMLVELEHSLKNEGVKTVYLQTQRNAPAKLFYESLGYQEYGHVSLHKSLS